MVTRIVIDPLWHRSIDDGTRLSGMAWNDEMGRLQSSSQRYKALKGICTNLYAAGTSQTTKKLQNPIDPTHFQITSHDLTKTNRQWQCHQPSLQHQRQPQRCRPTTCSAPPPLANSPPRFQRPSASPWVNTIPRIINHQPQLKYPHLPQPHELHFLLPICPFQLQPASEDRRNVPDMRESHRISSASYKNTSVT